MSRFEMSNKKKVLTLLANGQPWYFNDIAEQANLTHKQVKSAICGLMTFGGLVDSVRKGHGHQRAIYRISQAGVRELASPVRLKVVVPVTGTTLERAIQSRPPLQQMWGAL